MVAFARAAIPIETGATDGTVSRSRSLADNKFSLFLSFSQLRIKCYQTFRLQVFDNIHEMSRLFRRF